MILAIAYNPHFALMVTFGLCLLTSLALGRGIGHFLVLMGGTAAGVLTLNEVRTRTKLIKVGATAALGYFVLTWATGLWQNQPIDLIAQRQPLAGRLGPDGRLLPGRQPAVRRERASASSPASACWSWATSRTRCSQELVRRAPGTYNHSITVGAIAEAAAERIGANALLVRIGAYFHDIGKMLKPHYFVENQVGGDQPPRQPRAGDEHADHHRPRQGRRRPRPPAPPARADHRPDRAAPRHDAGRVLLPRGQPRGTSGNPDAATVQESAFRYPGPKPQTKEAGILMIADAVESASRTLSEPTPARIESLVRDLIDEAAARRPVRRVRPDPPRDRRDPREPDQVADRHLPRPRQVSRTADRLTVSRARPRVRSGGYPVRWAATAADSYRRGEAI